MSDIDEKLDNTLNSMKNQINEEKLSDDFKEKLCKKLEESEEKTSNKSKMHFPKSLIAVAACFVFILGCGFAGELDNLVLKHFSNIDDVAKRAVEEGKVEYLNQDYVTDQGISIKADYMFQEDGDLYIVLEAKSDEKCKIYMNEYEILDDNNMYLYKIRMGNNVISSNLFYSFEKDTVIYMKIKKLEKKGDMNCENINHIYIKSFLTVNDVEGKSIEGNWKIKLK